jgi:hypothetical protein
VFLRRSETLQESILKIVLKAYKPSSAESFSFQTPSKAYSVAAYVLTHKSVLVSDKVSTDEEKDRKVSLLQALKNLEDLVAVCEKQSTTDKMNYLDSAFPASKIYSIATKTIEKKARGKMLTAPISSKSMSYRYVKTSISRSEFVNIGSIKDSLMRLWFGVDIVTYSRAMRILANYKILVPWLCEDLELSFQDSPFDDKISMMNHISQLTPRSRSIAIMLPTSGSISLHKMFDVLQRRSFLPGTEVEFVEDTGARLRTKITMTNEIKEKTHSINNKLTLISTSLEPSRIKEDLITDIILDHRDHFSLDPTMSSLDAIQKVYCMRKDENLLDVLSEVNHDAFCIYLKSQRFDKKTSKWVGRAELVVIIESFKMVINLLNDKVTSVVVNDGSLALIKSASISKLLQPHLKDLKCGNHKPSELYLDLTSKLVLRTTRLADLSCPIIVNVDLNLPNILRSDYEFKTKINFRQISLDIVPINNNISSIGKQTIASYAYKFNNETQPFSDKDFNKLKLDDSKTRLMTKYWLTSRKYNPNKIFGFLINSGIADSNFVPDAYVENFDTLNLSHSEKEGLQSWIKDSYNKRLQERGYLVHSQLEKMILESRKTDDDEYGSDDDVGDWDFDFSALDDSGIDGLVNELVALNNQDIDNFTPNFDEIEAVSFGMIALQTVTHINITPYDSCVRYNKFWDKVIDVQRKDDAMNTCLQQSKKYKGSDTFLRIMDSFRNTVTESLEELTVVVDLDHNQDDNDDSDSDNN